ncbi:MAG: cysteine desulfurase family protein [bacterium]
MSRIYFDHSATTPVDQQVLSAMLPYLTEEFGNPSSLHGFGQVAAKAVDTARQQTATALNCQAKEIVFTSGSTEANNLAIKGLIKALALKGVTKPHIITSLIEHDAVIEPCRELVQNQQAEVTYIKVKANGVIDLQELESTIKDNTVLISIMYANSEVGSIQPIREIGKIVKKYNEKRIKDWEKLRTAERGDKPQALYFHTDATQAVNFCNIDTQYLHVDMFSLSGHKIYGPKGVGALFVKQGTPISCLQRGGHHENNMRSGTLNVPGIVGLGTAITLAVAERDQNNVQITEVRDYLIEQIQKAVPKVILNTDREVSTPSHAHFSFLGVEGEAVLMGLDLEGQIAVSTGSACASSNLKASHVLLAMGIAQEVAHNAVRFTLGKHNTKQEVDIAVKVLAQVVERYRKMVPEF